MYMCMYMYMHCMPIANKNPLKQYQRSLQSDLTFTNGQSGKCTCKYEIQLQASSIVSKDFYWKFGMQCIYMYMYYVHVHCIICSAKWINSCVTSLHSLLTYRIDFDLMVTLHVHISLRANVVPDTQTCFSDTFNKWR